MRWSDALQFAYLAPTAFSVGAFTAVQVKSGPGRLRFIWVMDDVPPFTLFNVLDGTITQSQSPIPGLSIAPTVNGTPLFTAAHQQLGPMWLSFENGLVIQYQNNNPQLSGFVAFQ